MHRSSIIAKQNSRTITSASIDATYTEATSPSTANTSSPLTANCFITNFTYVSYSFSNLVTEIFAPNSEIAKFQLAAIIRFQGLTNIYIWIFKKKLFIGRKWWPTEIWA